MKVIFTHNFLKNLNKIGSICEPDIVKLITKYPHTNNLIVLDVLNSSEIIKGYLLSKKVRILILFQKVKGKFIPISIVKKESSIGKNITKENYTDLFLKDIEKITNDLECKNFTEIEF